MKDEPLNEKDIANMSSKEVLNLLLFDSHLRILDGPPCRCKLEKLKRFVGMLHTDLCENTLEEVDLTEVPDHEAEISSLCSCQTAHFFKMIIRDGKYKLEECEGDLADNRPIRLPNYYQ